MDYSDKLPSTILTEAAQNLERGNWTQGNFFKLESDQPCFCAHGSIQYCGSQKIKKLVDQKDLGAAARAVRHQIRAHFAAAIAPPPEASERRAAVKALGVNASAGGEARAIEYWDRSYQSKYPQYRNLFLAHHYAQRAGLSYGFNDAPDRTKEEVIAKLREAAILVESENN